jgi:hypothetical protein
MGTIFRPALFRVPDFRRLGASVLFNSIGMMGETVVLGWLALELTNSPLLVGVAMSMRMLPLFFVGVPAGAVADRFPRNQLLMLTGAGQALTASTLGTLAWSGHVTFAHVLVVTLAAGTLRGLEHATRQSYTHDVVGADALMPGLAVLGVAMRVGWLVGSLGAGVMIARLGSGAAYFMVAAGFLGGAAALVRASTHARAMPRETESLWRGIVDFARALRTERILVVLMMLTSSAEILGFSHQALLPSLARDVLRAGPEALGTLNAARSVGGIVGLAATALRRSHMGGGAMFVAVLVSFGASLLGLASAPLVVGLTGVVVVLVVVNALGALADLLAQSLLQLSVPSRLRGRAGGAWVVAIGLAPLGQLQIGAVASLFGVGVAFGASGLALTLLAGATALLFPRLRRL